MPDPINKMTWQTPSNNWRDFQQELHLKTRRKKRLLKLTKLFISSLIGLGLVYGIKSVDMGKWSNSTGINASTHRQAIPSGTDFKNTEETASLKKPNQLDKASLKKLLETTNPINADTNTFVVHTENRTMKINTSLNMPLQRFILSKLARSKSLTRGKPQRIALVAMEPATGRILAMAGFDLSDPKANPCAASDYPAASIFKIVTAAAAVETRGYTPATPLYFNGGKYTLYKRQLKESRNKYTTRVSFASAFAESINPVFGKIGANALGGSLLKQYAEAFGFNNQVDSELDFSPSTLSISDASYQWAEVGCGFNTTTTISPLFGAMLAGTIVNKGRTAVPSLVETVTDGKGELLYKRATCISGKPVTQETAATLMTLMKKTVTSGTARSVFKSSKRDKTLSRITMGGKTGSLYNRDNTVKYDWFTGFGRDKNTDKELSVSVVVGHRKYIGTRAASYGKMIIKEYFKGYFASSKKTAEKG